MTNNLPATKSQLSVMPKTKDDVMHIAEVIWNGGFAKHLKTHQEVFACIHKGIEVGLSPMSAVQQIAMINGKPSLYGDAAMALVQASGLLLDVSEEVVGKGDNMEAICIVERKDRKTPVKRTFSADDAKQAGLWGKTGPWQQYKKRMLQMRARGFALRDCFADVLNGLHIAEEVTDYQLTHTEEKFEDKKPIMIGAIETPADAPEVEPDAIDAEIMPDEGDGAFPTVPSELESLLVDTAEAAASLGMKRYELHFKSLSPEQRKLLVDKDFHENNKIAAGRADNARENE